MSETAVTARGIVAGCGAAMAMLRAVLIPTLDEFSVHYTSVGLKVYADDIAMSVTKLLSSRLCCSPRMAVDQLVYDIAVQSGLGCQLGQVSGCCLTCQTPNVHGRCVVVLQLAKRFAQFWAEQWCEGVCRGCVAWESMRAVGGLEPEPNRGPGSSC